MGATYIGMHWVWGIITIILSIVLNATIERNPNKRTKNWNIFLGVSVVSIIFDIVFICVMTSYSAGIGERIGMFIAISPIFVTHLILVIIALFKPNNYIPEIIRCNKNFIITALIVAVLTGMLVAIPKIVENVHESQKDYNQLYASELKYLTTKYGDQKI